MKVSTALRIFGIFYSVIKGETKLEPQTYFNNFTVCNNFTSESETSLIVRGINAHLPPQFINLMPGECGNVNPLQCNEIDDEHYICETLLSREMNLGIGGFTANNNGDITVINTSPQNACMEEADDLLYMANEEPANNTVCSLTLKR